LPSGAAVYSKGIAADFTPSQYNSGTAHFYLGQSSYPGYHGEGDHNDYKGKMSDFRVYGSALTAEEVISEYSLEITDFKTAEYTFDDEKAPGKDSVRGYDLKNFNGVAAYSNGALNLSEGAAVQLYNKRDGHNVKFFDGHSNLTVSMDINIRTSRDDVWRRIMDMYAAGENRITFMAYCPRGADGSKRYIDAVYRKDGGDHNMLSDDSFEPKNGDWFNLTIVMSGTQITVWEDEVLKVTGSTGEEKPEFAKFIYDLANSDEGNFTIGTCSYETFNYLNADYDNIRIYAAAAKTADEVRAARSGFASYILRYEANNGTGDFKEQFVEKNTATAVAENMFVKEGFAFAGWNTQADGKGTSYPAASDINMTGDVVLYAQWANASNRITFDANGGRGEMPEQTVNFGTQAAINECAFGKTGHVFVGWNTSADGSGTSYAADAPIELNGDITLYAQWTAKTYTVTFDANGGDGTMQKQSMTYGVRAALSANGFTKRGYAFGGWALTSVGAAVYTDGQKVDGIEEGNDVTLYAVWIKGSFTVTFDANGGSGEMTAQTGDPFSYIVLNANAFTNAGKEFTGWAVSANGEVVYADGAQIALDDNITLYAVWKEKDTPDTPDTPDNPDDPDEPDNPDTPDDPDTPDEPGKPADDKGGKGLSGGAVAGIVIGCVAALGAAVAAVIIVKKKKGKR